MIKETNNLYSLKKINKKRAAILVQLDNARFKKDISSIEMNELPNINSLFVENNDIILEEDIGKWNYTYWTKMCIELSNNFSREKLKHIIKVMVFLRKKKDPKFMPVKTLKKNDEHVEVISNNDGYIDRYILEIKKHSYTYFQ